MVLLLRPTVGDRDRFGEKSFARVLSFKNGENLMLKNVLAILFVLVLSVESLAHVRFISQNEVIVGEVVDKDLVIFNGAEVGIIDSTINGNVLILDESSVVLSQSVINGSVGVFDGSEFVVNPTGSTQGSAITGSIVADQAAGILLLEDAGTSVGGNVIITRSGPDIALPFADSQGSVVLKKNNTVGPVFIYRTTLGGAM